jgi:tyrosine-protein kinase Etk/Wzc
MPTETRVSDPKMRAESAQGSPLFGSAARGGDEISLLDLLIVLAERRRTILWTTAIVTIAAIAVSLLLPTRYTASVTLLPPQQNSSLSSQLAAQLGSVGGMAATLAGGGSNLLKNPNDTYVAMFKSRSVEDAMIQHFGLMQEYHDRYLSDARKSFEHHAAVDGSTKDGLIHISVDDRDPRRAAELANGYVDQFRNLSQHLAITEAGQRRAFFEEQLKQANQNLEDAEEGLKDTQQKTGLIQLDSQARALIESAAALRAQITAKEVQIQGMRTFATGENAELVKAEQELEGLRAQLTKLGGSEDIPGSGLLPPRGQMTAAGIDYVRKLRDVKYYETIFDILARQFELAKLDEAKEGAIVQVVDPATTPDKRSFPKRGLIVAGAAAGGLFLGMFLALIIAGYERLKEVPETASKLVTLREVVSPKKRGNLHA